MMPPVTEQRRALGIGVAVLAAAVLAAVVVRQRAAAPGDHAGRGGAPPAAGGEAPDGPKPAAGHPLRGAVIDDYGRPVVGAVVDALRLTAGAWSAVATSATDEAGGFVLTDLPAGEYEIRARKKGFSDEAARGLPVPAPDGAPELRLILERTGTLRGRVVEDSGRPARGATVMLRDSGAATAPTAVAGDDGTFTLPDLPAGVYGAQARLGVFVSEVAENIELAAGSEAWVDLELAASAALAGTVADRASGQPIPGARLLFDPGVLGPGAETVAVGGDGRFAVAGLRAGTVRVVAEAPGYVPATGLGQAGGGALLAILLDRAATLSGVVLDEAGEPVAGAELEVLAEGVELAPAFAGGIALAASDNLGVTIGAVPKIPISGSGSPLTLLGGALGGGAGLGWRSGPDGSFEIAPVAPGRVRVMAHHPELSPGETRPLELGAGARVDGLRITLEAGGMLFGEVRDADDRPAAGVAIELSLDAGELRRTTVSDHAGRFQLGPVRGAGVVVAHPPGEPAVQAEVEIGPNEDVPVVLRLSGATASITGEVRGGAGQPLVSTVVRVQVPGAEPPILRTAVTDARGRFAVEGLPQRTCRLEIEHPDHAPFAIDIVPGGPLVEVELAEGARVLAEVRDALTGKPLAGALVTLRGALAGGPLRGRTDRSGKVEVRSVITDDYEIIAEHTGYASGRLAARIDGSEERTDVGVLELIPAGSATGQVVDRYGSTVAGAEVAAGDPPRWSAAVRTARDGRFRVAGLGAGEVVLTARGRSGTRSEPIEARIEAGEETRGLVLRLPDAEDSADEEPAAESPVGDRDRAEASGPSPAASRPERARAAAPPSVAVTLGYAQGEVSITEVLSASARAAGLRPGDVLVSVDGEAVLAASQGRAQLRGAKGSVAALEVRRDGKRLRLRVPRE